MKILPLLLLFSTALFAQTSKDSIPNLSIVSLEQAHILYRGISNPIKIAVPNAKSFTATGFGLEKLDDSGNYLYTVTGISGIASTIDIDIILNDGKHKHEQQVFEIREIQKPHVVINGNYLVKSATIGLTKQEFKLLELTLGFQNFQYTIKNIEPIYFNIIWPDKTYSEIKGNKLDSSSLKKLKRLSSGSIITIDRITMDMGGACGPGYGPIKIVLVK